MGYTHTRGRIEHQTLDLISPFPRPIHPTSIIPHTPKIQFLTAPSTPPPHPECKGELPNTAKLSWCNRAHGFGVTCNVQHATCLFIDMHGGWGLLAVCMYMHVYLHLSCMSACRGFFFSRWGWVAGGIAVGCATVCWGRVVSG